MSPLRREPFEFDEGGDHPFIDIYTPARDRIYVDITEELRSTPNEVTR